MCEGFGLAFDGVVPGFVFDWVWIGDRAGGVDDDAELGVGLCIWAGHGFDITDGAALGSYAWDEEHGVGHDASEDLGVFFGVGCADDGSDLIA